MIRVTSDSSPDNHTAVEEEVNQSIKQFDAWFQGLGNDPIVRGEFAIIKTYLYYKLIEERDGTQASG